MKKLFSLLVALSIFMLCATVGYTLATRTSTLLNQPAGAGAPQGSDAKNAITGAGKSECLLSIQVDRLDVQRPRLVSAWATYLFFDETPYKINFLPVYFPSMTSGNAKALADTFELDNQGEPAAGFWRAFGAFKVACKNYIMIDEYGVIKVLDWINDREDMASVLQQSAGDTNAISRLLEEACDKVTGSAGHPMPPFHWTDLAPGHIRTNLTMDTAMLYWERAVNAPSPDTCSVSK